MDSAFGPYSSNMRTCSLERRAVPGGRNHQQPKKEPNLNSHRSMQNINQRMSPKTENNISPIKRHKGGEIKRILLTRKYRHENVFKDLGIRVTGGKRLRSGDLGAFVTSVNRSKAQETLGEVQEGDQVLEWNGVLLRGKTFEEVERIIGASTGEIEIIIKCSDATTSFPRSSLKTHRNRDENAKEGLYDCVVSEVSNPNFNASHRPVTKTTTFNFNSPKEAPPIPAHGQQNQPNFRDQQQEESPDSYDPSPLHTSTMAANNNMAVANYQRLDSRTDGHIQLVLTYDHFNSVLRLRIISARGLKCRDYGTSAIVLPNPFVKVYLLPGRKVANKRRTKYIPSSRNPEWNQNVDWLVGSEEFTGHYLELTVWDYDKYNDNKCMGQVIINLADNSLPFNTPRWYPLQSPTNNASSSINNPSMEHTNGRLVNGVIMNNTNSHFNQQHNVPNIAAQSMYNQQYVQQQHPQQHYFGQRKHLQTNIPINSNSIYHNQQLFNDYNPANLDSIGYEGYPAIA